MRRLTGWLLVAAVLATILAAVYHWRSPARMGELRAENLAQPGSDVLVGVSWPFAEDHDGLADGMRLAQDEINAEGGPQVRLVRPTHHRFWNGTRRIAMEFARDTDMSAVIGYHDDSEAIRASSIYESSRLLHLVVGSTSTALTDHGNLYVLHTLVGADKVARSLAYAEGGQRYAVVWEKDGQWDSLVAAYKVAQDTRGADLAFQYAYSRSHADFRHAVIELKTSPAQVVLFVGDQSAAADFLARANTAGLPQTIICACANTPAIQAIAGAGEGPGRILLLDFYDEHAASAGNRQFVTRFKARYGRAPDTWAAQGYDALKLVGLAVRTTGSRLPDDLALALRHQPAWQGANGPIQFDEHGELADKPVYLKRYRNGTLVSTMAALPAPETPLRRPASGIGARPASLP